VATNNEEDKKLESLLALAASNGLEGVTLVSGRQAAALEPNVQATSALYLNTTGIIDAGEYVNTLARLAAKNGVDILKRTEVTGVDAREDGFTIKTDTRGEIDVKYVINAAGLHSDEVARMINPAQRYQIAPVRGEYFSFNPNKEGVGVQRNVYPSPKPNTVGIHLTPTMDPEKVIVGPTAIDIASKTDLSRNRQPAEYFFNAVKPFFPNLREEDLREDFAGIRAKLKNHYDFVIKTDEQHPGCLHLIGIDSPGLTSSQAIAKRVKIKEGKLFFE
jgi:glycerol-3-phosphate dehydrogenase